MLHDIIICEETASECLPYDRRCSYCAQHRADFCIPEFQRLAFEMCWFESANFEMSPPDIEIKLIILFANLKF
jgi:hypothetical protein